MYLEIKRRKVNHHQIVERVIASLYNEKDYSEIVCHHELIAGNSKNKIVIDGILALIINIDFAGNHSVYDVISKKYLEDVY